LAGLHKVLIKAVIWLACGLVDIISSLCYYEVRCLYFCAFWHLCLENQPNGLYQFKLRWLQGLQWWNWCCLLL